MFNVLLVNCGCYWSPFASLLLMSVFQCHGMLCCCFSESWQEWSLRFIKNIQPSALMLCHTNLSPKNTADALLKVPLCISAFTVRNLRTNKALEIANILNSNPRRISAFCYTHLNISPDHSFTWSLPGVVRKKAHF